MGKLIKFIWIMMFIVLVICLGGFLGLMATVLFPLVVFLTPFAVIAIIWMILNP